MNDFFPCPIDGLPGAEIIGRGVLDAANQSLTKEALLVLIAGPALDRLGVKVDYRPSLEDDAEILLYQKLQSGDGDPYSEYNSLLRLLVSFTRALAQRAKLMEH